MSATLERTLVSFGVQPRPLRALFVAFARMAFRGQHFGRATGVKPAERVPPLVWVLAQYAFVGLGLAFVLGNRIESHWFAFVCIAVSMLLTAVGVTVEFGEAVFSRDDAQIVGAAPIHRRTYAAARLLNLSIFVAMLALAVNAAPLAAGAYFADRPWEFALGYVVGCILSTMASASLAVAVQADPNRDRFDAVRETLAWTQIVLVMVVVYGGQYVFRDADHGLERFFQSPPGWLWWTPPAWFASLVADSSGGSAFWKPVVVLSCATLFATSIAVGRLGALYSSTARARFRPDARAAAVTGRVRPFRSPLLVGFTGDRQQAAIVALCLRMLARDGSLRMRTLHIVTTACAVSCVGLASGQLQDPARASVQDSALSVVAVYAIACVVPALIQNFSFSPDFAASWILRAAPVAHRAVLAEAVRLVVCYAIAAPLLAALFVCFAVLWRDPVHAALVVGPAWCAALVASRVSVRLLGFSVPFAHPPVLGSAGGSAFLVFGVFVCGAGLVSAAHLFAARHGVWIAPFGLALAFLAVISTNWRKTYVRSG